MSSQFVPFFLNHNIAIDYIPAGSSGITAQNIEHVLRLINENSGNSIIAPSVAKHLGIKHVQGLANMFDVEALASVDPHEVNERFSHVILVMQDQIQQSKKPLPWQQLADWMEKIKRPVIPVSVGANTLWLRPQELASSLPRDMIRFLQLIAEKAPMIGVRGEYTAELMAKVGVNNVGVIGCPSYFYLGPHAYRHMKTPSVELQRHGKIAGMGLFACAEPERVRYFLQSEKLLLLAYYDKSKKLDPLKIRSGNYPHYATQVVQAFDVGRIEFHLSPDSWMHALQQDYFLACGSRVHGTIISLLAGLPALCTAGDTRSKELSALFKFPHLPGEAMSELTAQQIFEKIDLMPARQAYGECYDNFLEFLRRSGLSPYYQA